MAIDKGTSRLRIGYLPFYVSFYETVCSEINHEKVAVAKSCAEKLGRFGEVIWDGCLIRDVRAAEAAGRQLMEQDVDCAVAVTTIAVFSGIPIAALRNVRCPLLIWNPQLVHGVGQSYSMVDAVRNTSQVGTQALANTLLREGIPYRVITGYVDSTRTATELERYFRIMCAVASIRRAKLLSVGKPIELMDDLLLNEEDLARHLGATVSHVDVQTLTSTYQEVSQRQVDDHICELKHRYWVDDLSTAELERSVRLSEALDEIVKRYGADGGTLNCQGENCRFNPEIGVTACYSLGVQNGKGRPFTCTGDLPTALAMLLCKSLTGVSLYTEVQLMDEELQAVVLANTGEGEDGLRRPSGTANVRRNALFEGKHGRGASFCYQLRPGPATLVSLTPTPKGKYPYRLIVAEGEVRDEYVPIANSIAGFFRFAGADLHAAYTRWLQAGPVHHASTTVGHVADELREIALLLDMEFKGVTE